MDCDLFQRITRDIYLFSILITMKRFLTNLCFFTVLASIPLVIEMALPKNFFTYRFYEALTSHGSSFVPNFNGNMIEEGDLAYRTPFAIPRQVTWHTDKLGFRNDQFIEKPDVIITGYSNIVGSSLSQEKTLPNVLVQQGIKAYSIAPKNFNFLISLIENHVIEKPQMIVFAAIERTLYTLPTLQFPKSGLAENIPVMKRFLVLNPFVLYMKSLYYHLKNPFISQYFKSRLFHTHGSGIQSPIDPKMFFYQGSSVITDSSDTQVNQTAEVILSYQKYCKDRGIDFLFFPIPNKETVYYDLIPLAAQPNFLEKLDAILVQKGVPTLNTFQLFNQKYRVCGQILYSNDDSHWNENAVTLVAGELVNYMKRGTDSVNIQK